MMAGIIPLIWLGAAFLALFAVAELLYRRVNVAADHTRSIVHVGTGLLTLLFPIVLDELWQVVALCGSFLIILLASMRFGWLPSINAVKRRTQGSWLYPVIVVVSFAYSQHMRQATAPLFKSYYYFAVPLLLLAICDPVAAAAGRIYRQKFPDAAPGKTFAGSFSFFIIACIITICGATVFSNGIIPAPYFIATGIATSYAVTLAERFSSGGWDNFTIPMTAIGCSAAIDYAL